ncbi:hypothetical protein CSUI_010407, partial [Cystoisospora suis]
MAPLITGICFCHFAFLSPNKSLLSSSSSSSTSASTTPTGIVLYCIPEEDTLSFSSSSFSSFSPILSSKTYQHLGEAEVVEEETRDALLRINYSLSSALDSHQEKVSQTLLEKEKIDENDEERKKISSSLLTRNKEKEFLRSFEKERKEKLVQLLRERTGVLETYLEADHQNRLTEQERRRRRNEIDDEQEEEGERYLAFGESQRRIQHLKKAGWMVLPIYLD